MSIAELIADFSPEFKARVAAHERMRLDFEVAVEVKFARRPSDRHIFVSGGEYDTTAHEIMLPEGKFDEVKAWLTEWFGSEPTEALRWNYYHRKNAPVLQYAKDHPTGTKFQLNLIRMMNRRDKFYILLSWT